MIYFLHGTNIDKGRAKAHELIDSMLKKKPDASFYKMDTETFDVDALSNYIESQGLFENKYIVFLDRISGDKNHKEEFLKKIKEIAESKNIFIILEGKLDKVSLGKIEKKAEKTQEFMLKETSASEKKEAYNAFSLADAFGKKDIKNLWILYRKAIDKGEVPEALHGMLFWKIKTMLINNYLGPYTKEELQKLAEKLVTIYHEARRGNGELETKLENLVLSL